MKNYAARAQAHVPGLLLGDDRRPGHAEGGAERRRSAPDRRRLRDHGAAGAGGDRQGARGRRPSASPERSMEPRARNNSPMDNLCHTLVGAAIGEAGLKSRTRFGNPALMIASNLPDIDVLVFATGTPAVSFRSGWTHGVLAQALLPLAFVACLLLWDRWRPSTRLQSVRRARAGAAPADRLRRRSVARPARLSEQLRRAAADAVLGPLVLRRHPVHRRRLDVAPSGRWACTSAAGADRPTAHGSPSPLAAAYIVLMLVSASVPAPNRARGVDPGARQRAEGPDGRAAAGHAALEGRHRRCRRSLRDGHVLVAGATRASPTRHGCPNRTDDPAVGSCARESERSEALLGWSRFPYFDLDGKVRRAPLRDVHGSALRLTGRS